MKHLRFTICALCVLCVSSLNLSAQSILTADGLAAFGTNAPAAGGGGSFPSGALLDWRYNGDLTDASGNGHNASVIGGTAHYSTNELNVATKSIAFNGSSDVNGLTDGTIAAFTTSDFSFSTWVFYDGADFSVDPAIFSKGQFQISGYNLLIHTAAAGNDLAGYVQFSSYQSGAAQLITSPDRGILLNTWYNIVTVKSGTTLTIYINGVSAASGTVINPTADTAVKFWVGEYSGGGLFWTGNIAQLTVWARALTSTEVGNIFSGGSL